MTARRVVLEGGAPWGFRMHGGKDHSQLLRISRVNPGSKAALRSIREGDLISSINGQNTKDLTNAEAHALLKQSGNNLTLGLNEDTAGSPKRRQFRTIHQETVQETLKKSSITSHTVKKTLEIKSETGNYNENSTSKNNETTKLNGTSNKTPSNQIVTQRSPLPSTTSSSSTSSTLIKEDISKNISNDNAEACSQRSSYTNCTLSPSSTSLFSEDGYCTSTESNQQSHLSSMNDNNITSKSKKRRQRRNRRRQLNDAEITPADCDINDTNEEGFGNVEISYTVLSPTDVKSINSSVKASKPIKSRSLDDDDMVNIQEISEISESEERDNENQAIVSEASESETEWEETLELHQEKPLHGSLSTRTLILESYYTDQVTLISPEEEKNLRDFLESLNLINGPTEAAKQLCDKDAPESIKQKKAKNKHELDQYFLPICQNPRYLEVISEEVSEKESDLEEVKLSKNLKQGTPELDLPPKVPPRRNRDRKKLTALLNFPAPIEQLPAVLVDTRIVETPIISEGFCNTIKAEEPSNVEVIFLHESSSNGSTEDGDAISNESFTIEEETSEEMSSGNEEINNDTEKVPSSLSSINMSFQLKGITENPDLQENGSNLIRNISAITVSNTQENLSGENETLTTSSSSAYNFSVKSSNPSQSIIDSAILSELTPPPTPENMSPKSEVYTNKKVEIQNSSTIFNPSRNLITDHHSDEISDMSKNNMPPISKIYTCVVSPPPPPSRSSSSEGSSSRESSLCTAKYISSQSSITDITEFTKEDEGNESKLEPFTLRELCLKFILQLPFGPEILQELAEVSKRIESFTSSLPSSILPKLYRNQAQFVQSSHTDPNHVSSELSVQKQFKKMSEVEKQPSEINIPIKQELTEVRIGLTEKEKANILLNKSSSKGGEVTIKERDIVMEELDLTKILKNQHIPIERRIPISKDWISNVDNAEDKQERSSKEMKIETEDHSKKEKIVPIITDNLQQKGIEKIDDKLNEIENMNVTKTEKTLPLSEASDQNNSKIIRIAVQKDWESKSFSSSKDKIVPVEPPKRSFKKPVEVNIPILKDWVGLPTEKDPTLLAVLSPKQKEELEKTKRIPKEADKLIELHEKFLNRRHSHEETRKELEDRITITSFNKNITDVSPSNRLLTIIKEEPFSGNDDINYLYFIEKEPRPSATLPRHFNTSSARLKARDLSEWLELARNKSMSESNLSNVPDYPENNLQNIFNEPPAASKHRRTSLPQEFYERQMIYIQEKEREIQKQLENLEEEKRKINAELSSSKQFRPEDFIFSKKGDYAESKFRPTSMPSMNTEVFRQQMYDEYMDKVAEREERKQHKVIKVTSSKDLDQTTEKAKPKEIIHPIHLEEEFMDKVKQKQAQGKLEKLRSVEKEGSAEKAKDDGEPVLVIDGEKVQEAKGLPKHLQEFVNITKLADSGYDIWSPGQRQEPTSRVQDYRDKEIQSSAQDDPISPIWTPKSASSSPTVEKKEFRSVNFHSPVLTRRNRTQSENLGSESPSAAPPWKTSDYSSIASSTSFLEKRLPTSHSSPVSGFSNLSTSPRLPKAQNPTITLLQKAREGHLPRGPTYIEQEQRQFKQSDRPPIANPGEVLYQIKNEYNSESDSEKPRRMADLGPRKFEGIGPVSKDGMPLILRSEIKDQNQSKWYKRMYDTIHKQKPHNDEYVTVRYKQRRAYYPYSSGYLSEPEPGAYDSDFTEYKYQTLDRKRPPMHDYTTSTMPRSTTSKPSFSDFQRQTQDLYKNQPGRIENYTPGHSSISDKEAKQWWDEVMDIFDGHLEQQKKVTSQPRSFINQALKESGYESDSTLIFRRREDAANHLNPKEQKEAYKVIQKGGDVPLHGLRKPAPERPKEPEPPAPPPKGLHYRTLEPLEPESPRKYVENEVTIHYKTPVRQEIKEYLSEDELAYRQAEAMKKIYQEERRKKYLQVSKSLQELQDINSRRHTDNFIPSQKSPIPLNRYDDFDDLAPAVKPRPRSPEPRLVARALYNFVGQTARELTFRKGDLIYVRRQVDKNWYEGELNAMVGLFPTNYVEIVPYDGMKSTPRKAHEGQARAKYNFLAQTHLELSLAKGELVVITRRVDDNWFEGKIGGRKGIFPASYVEVLIDPQDPPASLSSKPVAAPASHSLLLNGSAGGKESMGSHSYTPSIPTQLTSSYQPKAGGSGSTISSGYGSLQKKTASGPPLDQTLHIETQSEPIPYRALYKYTPQNDDELELLEGDTVYVLEKCDDGWYVGSSNRTGAFGTFPGNYVEKI